MTVTLPAGGQARPARWVLVYAGSRGASRPPYTSDELTRLVAVVDTAGRPTRWLCTGAIFAHLYAASGRMFTTWGGGAPANGEDWSVYLDSLFAPGAAFSRLDSAIGVVETTVGPLVGAFPAAIMIPYPDRSIGLLRFNGVEFDLKTDVGRAAAASAYITEALRRSSRTALRRVRFDGFYWLNETIPPGDTALVTRVARAVHAAGRRLLWIPYYTAQGTEGWRTLGIDEAWLQPNYFFHREVATVRLDSAADRAVRLGMGLELEFDGRLYADPRFGDRLEPYLAALATHPDLQDRSIAVYEGGGALIRLSASHAAADRERYRRLAEALK